MTHAKKHLPRATILSKTRYIGFNRQPVQDNSRDNTVSVTAPSSDYKLLRGRRWIDMESNP